MKKILIYLGDQQEKKDIIKVILHHMEIEHIFLNDDALSQYIGYLMELDNVAEMPINKQHFSNDLMILSDVSDDEIKQMNTLMSEAGIKMERKAMLTQHNKNWLLCDLMKEIEQEHHYFMLRDNIYHLLKSSEQLNIEDYHKDSWKQYEEAFYQGYEALQKECPLADLEVVYKQLSYAKEHLEKI